MCIAAFFNAVSQVILKKGAEETKDEHGFQKLLNRKVLLAYVIFGIVMLVNLYAYRGVDFKYGGIIQSIGQIFVLMLSVIFCGERMTKNRLVGNAFILLGIILYNFN